VGYQKRYLFSDLQYKQLLNLGDFVSYALFSKEISPFKIFPAPQNGN
jgi:hypothetical protein